MAKSRLRTLLASALFALALPATATVTTSFGEYSVTYDETTFLGGISFNSSGGGGSVGFGWNFPLTSTTSTSGLVVGSAALPEFTITPNTGYALAGPVSGFFGNPSYIEFGSGTTSVVVAGQLSVNGGAAAPISIPLVKTAGPNGISGIYSATAVAPLGAFSSFRLFGSTITATANVPVPGGLADISSQPQNEFRVSFIAAAVPEPETYLLFLVGLGLIGSIVRSRTSRAA